MYFKQKKKIPKEKGTHSANAKLLCRGSKNDKLGSKCKNGAQNKWILFIEFVHREMCAPAWESMENTNHVNDFDFRSFPFVLQCGNTHTPLVCSNETIFRPRMCAC